MSALKLPSFLRRRAQPTPASPTDTGEPTDWSIFSAHNPQTGQAAVFRARLTKPLRPDISELSTAIVIKWPYEPSNAMPPTDVNRDQLAFEEALDPLAPSSNSELVHVSTGMGLKEWIFYARSRDEFMAALNTLLSSHPPYPLGIEFYDDPDWRVWADMVQPLRKRTEN